MRFLLIVFAFAALWVSTFTRYRGADDIRAFILATILITSGIAAFSYTGRRRAFWAGFFGTMLVMATRATSSIFVGSFQWAQQLARELTESIATTPRGMANLQQGIFLSIYLIETLTMAALIGLLSVYVYDQSKK
jgi:hypothetical protein